MAAEFIGLVCGSTTGRIYAVINPDDDSELDNPRHLLLKVGVVELPEIPPPEDPDEPQQQPPALREPLTMVRIPRGEYEACLSMDDVAKIVSDRVSE